MVSKFQNMTVSFKQISAIPIGQRRQIASLGLADIISKDLTPGQRASLFPSYFKNDSLSKPYSGLPSGSSVREPSTPRPEQRPKLIVPDLDSIEPIRPPKASPGLKSGPVGEKPMKIMDSLMKDLGLSKMQAAAIVGNFAHESAGFKTMQERNPTSGRGGYGWAQWTGSRRTAFEKFAQDNSLDINSDDANYKFFLHEVQNDPNEKKRFEDWKSKEYGSLSEATIGFENAYERAGIKHHESRIDYASQFYQGFDDYQTVQIQKTVEEEKANASLDYPMDVQFEPSKVEPETATPVRVASLDDSFQTKPLEEPATIVPTPTQDTPVKDQIRSDQFGFIGSSKDEKFKGVDPRLADLIQETAKDFPLRTRVISTGADRRTGTHGHGRATDILLFDKEGNALPNYGKGGTAYQRPYEMFYQAMFKKAQEKYPELTSGKGQILSFGGYYGDRTPGSKIEDTIHDPVTGRKMDLKYGSADTMDLRILPSDQTRAGDGLSGLTGEYKGMYDYGHGDVGLPGSRPYDEKTWKEDAELLKDWVIPNDQIQNRKFSHVGETNSANIGPRMEPEVRTATPLPESTFGSDILDSPDPIAAFQQKMDDTQKKIDELGEATNAAAGGRELDKPHVAKPVDGVGPNVLLAETGPERVIPRHRDEKSEMKSTGWNSKIVRNDAEAIRQQPFQIKSIPMEETVSDQVSQVSERPQPNSLPLNTFERRESQVIPVNTDHPLIPVTARKAYADSKLETRWNNLSPIGSVYTNRGFA